MKVAITGGSGFVGKELVRYHLEKRDQVKVLTRYLNRNQDWSTKVELYHLDLLSCTPSELNEFVQDIDILYHCAGELYNTNIMDELHVEGTKKLLESVRSTNLTRWVQLSSVGVYGPFPSVLVDESYTCQPKGIYEITKNISDDLVIAAAKNKQFNCFILRPSIIFGPKMSNNSLFHLIKIIDKGLFFFIGKRGAHANYIHIDNVVHALILCAQCKPKNYINVYNLSDTLTIEEFVNIITNKLDKPMPRLRFPKLPLLIIILVINSVIKLPLTVNRIKCLTDSTLYNNEKIIKQLGYNHKLSLREGLNQMVEKYLNKY